MKTDEPMKKRLWHVAVRTATFVALSFLSLECAEAAGWTPLAKCLFR